jgi:hypothetical protein
MGRVINGFGGRFFEFIFWSKSFKVKMKVRERSE